MRARNRGEKLPFLPPSPPLQPKRMCSFFRFGFFCGPPRNSVARAASSARSLLLPVPGCADAPHREEKQGEAEVRMCLILTARQVVCLVVGSEEENTSPRVSLCKVIPKWRSDFRSVASAYCCEITSFLFTFCVEATLRLVTQVCCRAEEDRKVYIRGET
jgi:hypothetical protein